MNSSKVSPAARLPAILPKIDEEFIRVVAQSIPDLLPLKTEVPKALAPDAEFRLREVIERAKSYMRHSKRSTMTVADIAAAYRTRDKRTPVGYGSGAQSSQFEFVSVKGAPGLFITGDSEIRLEDVVSAELPAATPEPSVDVKWMAVGGQQLTRSEDEVQDGTNLSKRGLRDCDRFRASVMRALAESEDDADLEDALRRISETVWTQPLLPSFVAFIRGSIHENARATGNTLVLFNSTRLIYALLSRDQYGVEFHYDSIMPALLTCLLGRRLGTGDHWALREFAAFVLRVAFERSTNPVARARAAKTIVAVLTDRQAPLESMFGAILGLAALGEEIFTQQFLPHFPALLFGLEKVTSACGDLETHARVLVEEKVRHVCDAIESAIGLSSNLNSDLQPLVDVAL